MKRKDNGKLIAIISLVLAVLSLSVAYATFSSQLDVNGTMKVDSKWGIIWDNLQPGQKTGYAVLGELEIDESKESVTGVIGTLGGPGDTITWTWNVRNTGNINVQLSGFSNTSLKCTPSNTNPGHVATVQEANDIYTKINLEFKYGGISLSNFQTSTYPILSGGSYIPVSMILSYSASSSISVSGPVEISFVTKPTFTFSQASAN